MQNYALKMRLEAKGERIRVSGYEPLVPGWVGKRWVEGKKKALGAMGGS